ncbi:MAG TPA: hypothetical protein VG711_03665, partial [Phycisphaerales bacterium]|nr:hypothetical protein [Phycisphaerales bacterium]
MAKSFHENELLELVEGTLDPARANAMRAKLASEPSLVHLVEGMTADREALRSTPEPVLPMDFVNEMGPRLARPMLMEPVHAMKPGHFRRQQRRLVRLRLWKRAAVAAGIVLVMGVSVVVLVKEMQRGGNGTEVAGTENSTDETTGLI